MTFTLTEVERNRTWLHGYATKLLIFSAVQIPQLFITAYTSYMSAEIIIIIIIIIVKTGN